MLAILKGLGILTILFVTFIVAVGFSVAQSPAWLALWFIVVLAWLLGKIF